MQIGILQFEYIIGYNFAQSSYFHVVIMDTINDINNISYKTFILGISITNDFAVMKIIGKTYPKFKSVRALGQLFDSFLSIPTTFIFVLENLMVHVVFRLEIHKWD